MVESIGNFNSFADAYEKQMLDALGVFGESSAYFAEYKVNLLASLVGNVGVKSVLDYGSGIGASNSYLRKSFPNSELWASDLSETSLNVLKERYPYTKTAHPDLLPKKYFDVIFVSCVFHHIPEENQRQVMELIKELLAPDGRICIFEHNPYNPITRRIVSNCEFDEGVILLRKSQLTKMSRESSPTKKIVSRYCLFFPSFLRKLSVFERMLRWIPMGGQYFVLISPQDVQENIDS